ncbi:putative glycoside hydrolase [Ammoniphilus sp. 3BR4]|uniref:putative glycoside hydrolase n=1 Tax=Ammoniphilus sp. 3BR4 TaxID=3158265 RepID=UPI003465E489
MRKTGIIFILFVMVAVLSVGCSQAESLPPSLQPQFVDPIEQQEIPNPQEEQAVDVRPAAAEGAKEIEDQVASENQEVVPEAEKASADTVAENVRFPYPDAVRGVYVTGHSAGGSKFKELLELVNSSDLNAMVIDVKDDYGWITFKMEGALEPYSKPFIKDPSGLLQTLADHQIYPIARIVVFKDSVLASRATELSFKTSGQVWKNRRGEAFVNPFLKKVWEHNLEIAKHAAKLGFQEIQFDYVRFPEGFEKRDKTLSYGMGEYTPEKLEPRLLAEWETKYSKWEASHKEAWAQQRESLSPADALDGSLTAPPVSIDLAGPPKPKYDAVKARVTAVTDFVEYAKKELQPYNVKVSVDIFGYTATLPEAPGIGQNFTSISSHVDVISSMIYPSHWGAGYFQIPKPDTDPYRLVQEYAKMENQKLAAMEAPPISRPWIQDFTAPWLGKGNYIPYGKNEVELQIRALNEAGIKEFLLWNAGNSYTPNVDYTPLK